MCKKKKNSLSHLFDYLATKKVDNIIPKPQKEILKRSDVLYCVILAIIW